MERFVAVLIEHCGGNFPLWLTTEQVAILPISEKHQDYAEKVLNVLNNYDIRAFIDDRAETTGRKIRDNETKKIPYMLVVGGQEEIEETVAVRKHGEGDLGKQGLEEFAKLLIEEVKNEIK
jgi:threonyl-tRNA synthetase